MASAHGPYAYAGIKGRNAQPKRSFFSLNDPGGTGTPILVNLPGGYPSGGSTTRTDLFTVKLYFGTSFLPYSKDTPPGSIGKQNEASLGASLTYRRDLQFTAGARDQAICLATTASFFSCPTINTAAPNGLKGFVACAQRSISPAFSTAEMGVEAKFTYAIDTEQVGLEVPV